MIRLVVLSILLGVAFGASTQHRQYHSQDKFGRYSYGYSDGAVSRSEMKSVDGITRGFYSYIDPEGKLQKVEYTVDPNRGYKATATTVPKGILLPVRTLTPAKLSEQQDEVKPIIFHIQEGDRFSYAVTYPIQDLPPHNPESKPLFKGYNYRLTPDPSEATITRFSSHSKIGGQWVPLN